MAGKSPHPNPVARAEHMARRNSQGLSMRKIADEFAVSKSTAHRYVQQHRTRANSMLRNGYTPEGTAR